MVIRDDAGPVAAVLEGEANIRATVLCPIRRDWLWLQVKSGIE